MSTITIVVVAIWNGLLLTALAAVITCRKRLLQWVTGLDRLIRNQWDAGNDDLWGAFLSDHPELAPGDEEARRRQNAY